MGETPAGRKSVGERFTTDRRAVQEWPSSPARFRSPGTRRATKWISERAIGLQTEDAVVSDRSRTHHAAGPTDEDAPHRAIALSSASWHERLDADVHVAPNAHTRLIRPHAPGRIESATTLVDRRCFHPHEHAARNGVATNDSSVPIRKASDQPREQVSQWAAIHFIASRAYRPHRQAASSSLSSSIRSLKRKDVRQGHPLAGVRA